SEILNSGCFSSAGSRPPARPTPATRPAEVFRKSRRRREAVMAEVLGKLCGRRESAPPLGPAALYGRRPGVATSPGGSPPDWLLRRGSFQRFPVQFGMVQ